MDYGINQVLLTWERSRAMVSENLRSKILYTQYIWDIWDTELLYLKILRYFMQSISEILWYRNTLIENLYFEIIYTQYIYFEIQDTSVVFLLLPLGGYIWSSLCRNETYTSQGNIWGEKKGYITVIIFHLNLYKKGHYKRFYNFFWKIRRKKLTWQNWNKIQLYSCFLHWKEINFTPPEWKIYETLPQRGILLQTIWNILASSK